MKRIIYAAALFTMCFMGMPALAQQNIIFANLVPLGFCQFTAAAASLISASCSGGIPKNSVVAVIVAETANVRWRDDGAAPTNAVGMLMLAGGSLYYQGDLTALQTIAVSGSPVVDISFYGTH